MPYLRFPFLGNSNNYISTLLLLKKTHYKIIMENNMKLELQNILITGRTYEEYLSFFDLNTKDLLWKKGFRLSFGR